MKRFFWSIRVFLIVFCIFHFSSAFADYVDIASYKIDIKLNDKTKIISGEEKISFLNTSERDIDTLYLHLYANAFSSDSTVFVKESKYLKKLMEKEGYRGFIKIKNVKSFSEELDYNIDETLMNIFLSEPLKPGKGIELSLEFELKLPKIIFRLGYEKDNFVLCEWFPKMAVLKRDGTWNAMAYHNFTEYFSDFGTYDVSITLPLKYIIDGTGYITAEKKNPDFTKTITFQAEKVHDFAWCASPDFRTKEVNIGGIKVIFLILPEDLYKFPRWAKAAGIALRYCNTHFGKYPYDKLVIVDTKIGPFGGAMECPMLITMQPELPLLPAKIKLDEWIIIHELVHQWWYGIVASNETEEAWLDEGFTTYITRKIMEQEYGKDGNLLDLGGIKISDRDIAKLAYLSSPKLDPIVRPSWESVNLDSYMINVYYKASLILELLEKMIGQQRMETLLKLYYHQYQFQHPRTDDFIKVAEEVAGQELKGFFENWLFSAKTCDYEVRKIRSEEKSRFKNKKEKLYESTVEIWRNGDIIMPIEILIELENGEKIKENWDGKDKWFKLKLSTKAKIKSAILDPENKIVLDINVNNNGISSKPYRWPIFKFFSDYLFWMESVVQWMIDFF